MRVLIIRTLMLVIVLGAGRGAFSQDQSLAATKAQMRLPHDRKTRLLVRSLLENLKEAEYEDATDDLRRLQTGEPETMIPTDSPDLHKPLYRILPLLAARFPDSKREAWDSLQNAAAKRALTQALKTRRWENLPSIILTTASTSTSLKALLLLAEIQKQQGRSYAARQILIDLLGPEIPADIRSAAAEMVEELTKTNDNEASQPKTADSKVSIPKHPAWQHNISLSARVRTFLDGVLQLLHERQALPVSSWRGEVSGDRLLRRTIRGIASVDLKTGKTLWEYPIGPPNEIRLTNDPLMRRLKPDQAFDEKNFSTIEQTRAFSEFLRDQAAGRVVLHGDSAYVVAVKSGAVAIRYMGGSRVSSSAGDSTLIALDKETGRRLWSFGSHELEAKIVQKSPIAEQTPSPGLLRPGFGGSSSSITAARQAVWIAGMPVVSGTSVYLVVEWRDEMRLCAVNAETGELKWSVLMTIPGLAISHDTVRRDWGATPFLKDGLIYCHTTSGWLCCVDALTRTVVFAGRINEGAPKSTVTRYSRGQPTELTPTQKFEGRWNASTVMINDEKLTVLPHESFSIFGLNALTGEQSYRKSASNGDTQLYSAGDVLILGGSSTRRINLADGSDQWKVQSEHGYPTGRVALRDGRLWIPLSSGRIEVRDVDTGERVAVSESLVPPHGWGHVRMMEGSNDIFLESPLRTIRLAQSPTQDGAIDPLDIAEAQLQGRQWKEALATASKVTRKTSPGRDISRAADIIFESRLQLASAEDASDAQLAEIRNSELSIRQKLILDVFEIRQAIRRNDADVARPALLSLLERDAATLNQPVPKMTLPDGRPANGFRATPSLQTWAAQALDDLLLSPLPDEVAERLNKLSKPVFLTLRNDAIAPLLIERLQKSGSLDEGLELLNRSIRLKRRSPEANFAAEADWLADQLTKLRSASDQDQPQHSEKLRLLEVIALELPAPLVDAVRERIDLVSAEEFDADYRQRRLMAAELWDAKKFKAMPVTGTAQMNSQTTRLRNLEDDDRFLRESLARMVRTTGRMKITSLTDPEKGWSIAGAFDLNGSYSNRVEFIQRVGSVLLVRSYNKLFAISVFDQRKLWTMTVPSSSMPYFRQTQNFKQYRPTSVKLPSRRSYFTFQVVGVGSDWVCVLAGSKLTMIDLMTGQVRWHADSVSRISSLFATDDFVIASGSQFAVYDRHTGQPIDEVPANLKNFASSAIRNFDEQLLVFKNAEDEASSPWLQWVDTITGDILRDLELKDLTHFDFVDDRTLAGFNDQQTAKVIDLRTGQQRSVNWKAKATPKAKPPKEKGAPVNGPPDNSKEMWHPERVVLRFDAFNDYIFNRPPQNRFFNQPYGRRLMPIQGELRAVDRETGELRWQLADDRYRWGTLDQPEVGLLLLIHGANPIPNARVQPCEFMAVSRFTGKQAFKQVLPSQMGLRYLTIKGPTPNILELTVQDVRVRLEGDK